MAWPRIVAESLRRLDRAPGWHRSVATETGPAQALAAIRAAQRPSRSTDAAPEFLRPGQIDPWRRVMAALARWRGALLIEPVGTGKTWIALAVAAAEARTAVAIVPAIVRPQWQAAAIRAGVPLHCWSHERTSRGVLPSGSPELVIIDEAHRLRDRSTRRVQTLAPWLVGRRTLLLTATPIVNRLADVITLLQIALPDDALRLDGIPSLQQLADRDAPPHALRRVAIRSAPPTRGGIATRPRQLPSDDNETQRAATAVAAVHSLALSSSPSVKRLLASVLLDAAASSEAAFRAALTRYRALLCQARDAGGASRQDLRRFAGASLDQLVMWELIAPDTNGEQLPLEDIVLVQSLLLFRPMSDAWIERLLAQCSDAIPTVCFARHRATADALRRAAGDSTAWVTGSAAGIGPHRMPREMVLAAFGPERAGWRARRAAPTLLIATDVAAEGLDLQAAGRIVHVDLPWTATRLEQREGRLLRIGQDHAQVEILTRPPAAPIERALRIGRLIRRKASLAERWLAGLEWDDTDLQPPAPLPAATIVTGELACRTVVAVELSQGAHRGVALMETTGDGNWVVRHELPPLDRTHSVSPKYGNAGGWGLEELLDSATRSAVLEAAHPGAGALPALVSHIHALARTAARRRAATTLAQLDRLLRFAAAPHTLGERMLLDNLLGRESAQWRAARIPDRPLAGPITARPIAVLLFRSVDATLR